MTDWKIVQGPVIEPMFRLDASTEVGQFMWRCLVSQDANDEFQERLDEEGCGAVIAAAQYATEWHLDNA